MHVQKALMEYLSARPQTGVKRPRDVPAAAMPDALPGRPMGSPPGTPWAPLPIRWMQRPALLLQLAALAPGLPRHHAPAGLPGALAGRCKRNCPARWSNPTP